MKNRPVLPFIPKGNRPVFSFHPDFVGTRVKS
jgi:hypothetical protein